MTDKKTDKLLELEEQKHKWRMEELEFIRETERIKFDQNMQLQRIKTAEIRRTMKEKQLKKIY